MSDEINISGMDGVGGKTTLTYETVFNLHVIKTNQQMQNLTSQKGVGIPIIMSLIASVMSMDGLIRNSEKMDYYKKEIEQRLKDIEMDMHNLGDASTDDRKFVDIWWKIQKTYNFQLAQMYGIGLAPAADEDDIMPTVKEKIEEYIYVPKWKPQPGDYDYKKDLGIPLTPEEELWNAPMDQKIFVKQLNPDYGKPVKDESVLVPDVADLDDKSDMVIVEKFDEPKKEIVPKVIKEKVFHPLIVLSPEEEKKKKDFLQQIRLAQEEMNQPEVSERQ